MMFTKTTRISIIALAAVFFAQLSMAQGAWTKNKGELYSQITYSTIPTHSEIFSDDNYVTSREITDNTIQLYAEYGLSDKLTLLATLPLKSISTGNLVSNSTISPSITESSKTGLGNIRIGLRHKINTKKYVLAGQLTIGANTGNFQSESGIRTGYDTWTFTPTLNIGKGYKNYFFQAFSGVDIRTNKYSSNFKVGGEFGYTAIKRVSLIAFLDVVISFNDGNVLLPQSNIETALYINNQEFSAIGLKGIYSFTDNIGLTLGVGTVVVANNVPKQLALSGGFYYKIN